MAFSHIYPQPMSPSPLTQWSREHIGNVFESRSDADAMLAIDQTFATSMRGTINGKDLAYGDMKRLVQGIRNSSSDRSLKVKWQRLVVAPAEGGGVVDGLYVIHGIFKQLPGYDRPVQFTRHKAVIVKIESLPEYKSDADSRRIVELNVTAIDKPVADRAYYTIPLFFFLILGSVGIALYKFRPANVFL